VSGLPVLFQSGALIAVDKPAGALVIPGRQEDSGPSLRERLEAQLGRKVFVVHRLDRDTSGVLLFALTGDAHRALSMAFEAGQVEKHYLALALGDLAEPADVQTWLKPARRGRMRPARPNEPLAKPARTLLRPLERFGRATLVEAQPLTGRTHQIRVHLLSLGHPLLVDPQYTRPAALTASGLGGAGARGATGEAEVLTRTPLHAHRLSLRGVEGIPSLELEAPLPAELRLALEILRAGGSGRDVEGVGGAQVPIQVGDEEDDA
jgi:RluA family pseudouridine synthase